MYSNIFFQQNNFQSITTQILIQNWLIKVLEMLVIITELKILI